MASPKPSTHPNFGPHLKARLRKQEEQIERSAARTNIDAGAEERAEIRKNARNPDRCYRCGGESDSGEAAGELGQAVDAAKVLDPTIAFEVRGATLHFCGEGCRDDFTQSAARYSKIALCAEYTGKVLRLALASQLRGSQIHEHMERALKMLVAAGVLNTERMQLNFADLECRG